MNGKLLDTNILIYLSKKKLEVDKIASPGKIYLSQLSPIWKF